MEHSLILLRFILPLILNWLVDHAQFHLDSLVALCITVSAGIAANLCCPQVTFVEQTGLETP